MRIKKNGRDREPSILGLSFSLQTRAVVTLDNLSAKHNIVLSNECLSDQAEKDYDRSFT